MAEPKKFDIITDTKAQLESIDKHLNQAIEASQATKDFLKVVEEHPDVEAALNRLAETGQIRSQRFGSIPLDDLVRDMIGL